MIEKYLSTEEFTSKSELQELTGLSERMVRKSLSDLKLVKPVIYNSTTKGYRLAKNVEDLKTLYQVAKEYQSVSRCIADIESRKKVFNMQERCYIAYLKDIEKLFLA